MWQKCVDWHVIPYHLIWLVFISKRELVEFIKKSKTCHDITFDWFAFSYRFDRIREKSNEPGEGVGDILTKPFQCCRCHNPSCLYLDWFIKISRKTRKGKNKSYKIILSDVGAVCRRTYIQMENEQEINEEKISKKNMAHCRCRNPSYLHYNGNWTEINKEGNRNL